MKTILLRQIIALLFVSAFLQAQTTQNIGIGEWRLHLPYKNCIDVTGNRDQIYGATESGLFILNQADNSIELLNKVNGLSDINVKAISWNETTKSLFVGYKNANIDIVKGKTIVNLPDIKRAQIVGNKTINSVYFIGRLAYVACGFGIVVVDMDRLEIKETYYIGPNGSYIEVNDITSDANNIYAATENGVYWAPLNSPNLANFSSWTRYLALPIGIYNKLLVFSNHLLANKYAPTFQDDVLHRLNLTTQVWDTMPNMVNYEIKDMITNENGQVLYIAEKYGVFLYNSNFDPPQIGYTYFPPSGPGPNPNAIFFDPFFAIWVADQNYGMVRMPYLNLGVSYSPDGPRTASVFDMSMENGHLIVAPGGKNDAWGNIYNIDGVFSYNKGDWITYNGTVNQAFDTIWDILTCAQVPEEDNHFFLGSWGRGLTEVSGSNVVNVYNQLNSTLRVNPATSDHVDIGGIGFDEDKNLWITNSFVTTCLNVRKADGTWQAFDFTGIISTGTTVGNILVTKNGQKWMILPRGAGMLVFDDNGTISNVSDDKKKKLGFTIGAGNISGGDVLCMAEDRDGEIWVGTDEGICVFYSPETVFNSAGFDAQQILIEQDGYVQILLETQVITAIAVDGANRKWIGTESGGVFLMSDDGTKQVLQFNTENSPLLSNTITSIVIDKTSGEVFFGTDKGIISYRGDATEGGETNGDVYAFPNPVKPEYDGPIAIKGLVKDADVKIADVRGNVVYQTKALGGQATWNGRNFKGERAATGIYLVFITNDDGTETAITKILFVN